MASTICVKSSFFIDNIYLIFRGSFGAGASLLLGVLNKHNYDSHDECRDRINQSQEEGAIRVDVRSVMLGRSSLVKDSMATTGQLVCPPTI
ncbi:hypothetical protein [Gimesia maris]|uniref:hypothetical protein n=1 Tax=Gimesia maris TaxID=122 RepID=UPI0002EB0D3F|nr:hypothetical protein [Gimesia maris]